VITFRRLSDFHASLPLGLVRRGDCVHVDGDALRALSDVERRRLRRDVEGVGARLLERALEPTHTLDTVLVHGVAEAREAGCE
jgi:hypothetical protein